MAGYDIPVVIIVYKRLDAARKMFEQVRLLRPEKLYIVSDGPKTDADKDKVLAVREYLDSNIDWDCQVHKRYLSSNMGLRYGIPAGIDWVFETEEKAVILEDDICASPSFFTYCKEMLEYYENDERIMMISGFNLYEDKSLFEGNDIALSRFAMIWGWATWKRAWKKYVPNIPTWKEYRKTNRIRKLLTPNVYKTFKMHFDDLQYHWYNSWAYQWFYALFVNEGYSIVPCTNLVLNMGINDIQGEHPGDSPEREREIGSKELTAKEISVKPIPSIAYSDKYDIYFQKHFYPKVKLINYLKSCIRASVHEKCYDTVLKMTEDEEYFDNILPDKYKLSEKERALNNNDKYKLLSPADLRFCAKAYREYKKTGRDLYMKQM